MRSVPQAAVQLLLAAACLATLPHVALSQAVVHGRVTSADEHAAVAAALVEAFPSGMRVRTDEAGRFSVRLAPNDSVRITALGFRERRLAAGSGQLAVVLERVPAVLAAVVTTIGQREMQASTSPAAVTVLTRDELDATAAGGVAQLLRQLPGLQEIPTQPSQTTISIRGLDAARVLLLVDGEPVSGALMDIRDIGRLSTLAAERIEVVKGPSSVEFGSDALGGVVNLVTAPPSDQLDATLTARGGAQGRIEGGASLSDTHGNLGYRVSGGWRQLDRVTAIDAEGTSFNRTYDLNGDARYQAGAVSLRVNAQWARERQRWPVGGGFNGFVDNHTLQGFVQAEAPLAGGTVRARLSRQAFAYQFRQAAGLTPITGSADSLEQTERQTRMLASYTRLLGQHTLDAGVQYTTRAIVAPHRIEGDRASDTMTELFARDSWLLGAFTVSAGARSTHSSTWGHAFTPSVGTVWNLGDTWRLRASVARGLRGPGFKEMRYTFTNHNGGYTVIGNVDLDPESSLSTEAGLTWVPAGWVALDAGVFRNALRDLIDTRFVRLDGSGFQVYQNVNVSSARTEGIELGARVAAGAVDASASYAYLRARNLETGEPLDRRSPHSARIRVSHTAPVLAGLVTDIGAWYAGPAPIGEFTQGAMLSVDAQVRVRVSELVELSVGINNALDRRPAFWSTTHQRQLYAGVRTNVAPLFD